MLIMSPRSRTKYVTATFAAAACLVVASAVSAIEPNDEGNAFAASPTAVCHPAYRPCQKQAPTDRSDNVSTVAYLASTGPYREAFGTVCHPAYRPCANWLVWVEVSNRLK